LKFLLLITKLFPLPSSTSDLPFLFTSHLLTLSRLSPRGYFHNKTPSFQKLHINFIVFKMAVITKFISFLLLATFGVVSLAAPPQAIHQRAPATILATPTRDAMAAVCTYGMSASKQHPAGYPINDYTVVTAGDNNWTSYEVNQDWYGEHFVSGPHVSTLLLLPLR
jgi:hypothetical protein